MNFALLKPRGKGMGLGQRRSLHSTGVACKEADPASAAAKKQIPNVRAIKWANNDGREYESGGGFVSRTPFPMNPEFKPNPIVSDQTKEEIYKHWASGSPSLEIAKRFGLSIIRVDAIVRMKFLEKRVFADKQLAPFPLQPALAKGMETILPTEQRTAAREGETNAYPKEPLRFQIAERLRPLFEVLDDDDAMTLEEQISEDTADVDAKHRGQSRGRLQRNRGKRADFVIVNQRRSHQ